jgi:hypothetical protein
MRRAGSGGVGRPCPDKVRTSFIVRILQSVVCIAVLAAATTRAADPDGNAPAASGLLSGLFHEKPRAQAKSAKKANETTLPPPSGVELPETQRQRHVNAWIRRMEVCDRLRIIADQTGNMALRSQADELEERANALYRQQTANLPVAAQAPLSVLAADQENPSRGRPATTVAAPTLLPDGRADDNNRRQPGTAPAALGGNMDQREQAILNGTSMGEDRP